MQALLLLAISISPGARPGLQAGQGHWAGPVSPWGSPQSRRSISHRRDRTQEGDPGGHNLGRAQQITDERPAGPAHGRRAWPLCALCLAWALLGWGPRLTGREAALPLVLCLSCFPVGPAARRLSTAWWPGHGPPPGGFCLVAGGAGRWSRPLSPGSTAQHPLWSIITANGLAAEPPGTPNGLAPH